MIPRDKYWTSNFPNLRASAEGQPIPELYGVKENISPVCVDTTIMKYQIANRTLHSIDAVQCDGHNLTSGTDYTTDLTNAQFTIYGMPKLDATTTYYMVLEGDFTVSAINYVKVSGDSGAGYSNGQLFYIDGGDSWTGQSADLVFKIYGKQYLEADEELMVEHAFSNEDATYNLRDGASRTKLGQSFLTGANDFYATRIVIKLGKTGSPTGNFRLQIHTDQSGTVLGGKSKPLAVASLGTSQKSFPQKWWEFTEDSEVLVTAQGVENPDTSLMENVADILEDVIVNVLDKDSSILDSTSFSALQSARTEDICAYLNTEISFNTFLGRLEAGSLFKFVPNLDGTFEVPYYQSGEPAGTPSLYDEDYISFRSWRDKDSVRRVAQICYNENPTTQIYEKIEKSSDIAKYIYDNDKTLIVETYLKDTADANTLGTTYIGLIEYPQRKIIFEVPGYGINLIPTQKVKITKTRADNTGGTFSAELFRILSLAKKLSTGTVKVTAILDSQSY